MNSPPFNKFAENQTVTLAGGIKKFFEKEGAIDFLRFVKIQKAWKEIVGERMTKVSRPLKVEGKTLKIGIIDSAYGEALLLKKQDILAYLGQVIRSDDIRFLKFKVSGNGAENKITSKN